MSDIINIKQKVDYKKYSKNYEQIEWREKGSFCEQCGIGFDIKNDPKRKYVDKNGSISYYCNPNGECNYN